MGVCRLGAVAVCGLGVSPIDILIHSNFASNHFFITESG